MRFAWEMRLSQAERTVTVTGAAGGHGDCLRREYAHGGAHRRENCVLRPGKYENPAETTGMKYEKLMNWTQKPCGTIAAPFKLAILNDSPYATW